MSRVRIPLLPQTLWERNYAPFRLFLRGLFQYGDLHLGQTRGSPSVLSLGTHSCSQRPHLWAKMFHYFQFRRDEFLQHYHKRWNVESAFSMMKAEIRRQSAGARLIS